MELERMNKKAWSEKYGELSSIPEKRAAIIAFVNHFDEHNKQLAENGDRILVGKSGWYPVCWLQSEICKVMGWMEEKTYNTWTGKLTVVDFDLNDERVAETIKRMSNQGIIKISKSGKGFKAI